MPFINVNDADFYYELHGQGQPLILVNGYTMDHNGWIPILDSLSKKYQVLIFDNRGVGQTTDDGRPLSAEIMADDVIALAQALKLEKPHVIGSSMGGTIAQQVGIRHSDKIRQLGICVSTPKWRHAMLNGLGGCLAMREANMDFDAQYNMIKAWVFGQAFLSNTENLRVLKEAILNHPHPQSLENQKRQFAVLEAFDATSQLSNISVPTLVMYGNEDILSLPYESEQLANAIPDATLQEFNCAHALQHEQPQFFCKTIMDFFAA